MNIELIYGAHMRLLARYGMWNFWQGAAAATSRSRQALIGRCHRKALKHATLGLVEHDRILHGRPIDVCIHQ